MVLGEEPMLGHDAVLGSLSVKDQRSNEWQSTGSTVSKRLGKETSVSYITNRLIHTDPYLE